MFTMQGSSRFSPLIWLRGGHASGPSLGLPKESTSNYCLAVRKAHIEDRTEYDL